LPEELKEVSTSDEDGVRVGSFHESIQAFKKELVRSALRMHAGNRLKAAIELGISRCYLHRLLNQFCLADEQLAQPLEPQEAFVDESEDLQPEQQRFEIRIA
jgi:DNA-binding NtrC family response regulator